MYFTIMPDPNRGFKIIVVLLLLTLIAVNVFGEMSIGECRYVTHKMSNERAAYIALGYASLGSFGDANRVLQKVELYEEEVAEFDLLLKDFQKLIEKCEVSQSCVNQKLVAKIEKLNKQIAVQEKACRRLK